MAQLGIKGGGGGVWPSVTVAIFPIIAYAKEKFGEQFATKKQKSW